MYMQKMYLKHDEEKPVKRVENKGVKTHMIEKEESCRVGAKDKNGVNYNL